ncbi:MAG: cell division protein SepF [Ruminococcus sp.]|nr:cell division protein SepF [Ruminococcus sp.]
MSIGNSFKSIFFGSEIIPDAETEENAFENENYKNEEYYEEETKMAQERPISAYSSDSSKARETRITSNSSVSGALSLVLARPNDFSEVTNIGNDVNAGKTVLLNLETVKSEDARRILDFLSGVAYANDATIKMMAQKTFAIYPDNVKFEGKDLLNEIENNGYSF